MSRGKREKPLELDMDFSEALKRFAQTDKAEVDESIERAKQKKPPGTSPPAAKRNKATPPKQGGSGAGG